MDTSKFKDSKTGKIVPIITSMGPDFAFVPDSLPPNWLLSPSLVPKLVEASRALSKLDGIGGILPDPELLMSPLRRREAIASSRIEGTYATAQELMLFEMKPRDGSANSDQEKDWREVANYSRALSQGVNLLKELPFCGRLMKELHTTLMRNVRGFHAVSGEWRTYQVAVGSDRRYIPPPADHAVSCMDSLENYVNSDSNIDPLIRAYMVHYQFEAIHPFSDGNGRVGRMLLALMIAHWCKLAHPWLYMSSFFEKFKDEYISNLFNVSSDGLWDKWIEFCLNGTIYQANDAIKRCEQLRDLKDEMLKRAHIGGSTRTASIITGLFKDPIVRVSRLRRQLKVTYPTAQNDVNRLVKVNILAPLDVRPKCYFSPEIWKIAYSENGNEI